MKGKSVTRSCSSLIFCILIHILNTNYITDLSSFPEVALPRLGNEEPDPCLSELEAEVAEALVMPRARPR